MRLQNTKQLLLYEEQTILVVVDTVALTDAFQFATTQSVGFQFDVVQRRVYYGQRQSRNLISPLKVTHTSNYNLY